MPAPDRDGAAATRLDVSLVAARRPDLLSRTLDSFGARVLCHFRLGRVHVNLDPIFGDSADHDACLQLIDRHLPGASVFQPPQPGFGAAVRRLWGASDGDGLVLHLEDDWIVLDDIPPSRVLEMFEDPQVAVAMPLCREHDRAPGTAFNERTSRHSWLGLPWRSRRQPRFGTSPQFLRAGFAREVAALMNPAMDPEKQMRDNRNPALERHQARYRCRLMSGPAPSGFLIEDIGRGWRDARGIEKVVRDGVSMWTQ